MGGGGLRVGLLGCCMAVLLIGLHPQPLIHVARQPFYDLQPIIMKKNNPEKSLKTPAAEVSNQLSPFQNEASVDSADF